MTQILNPKRYDLEDRCLQYAKRINEYVRRLPKDIPNIENGKQLVRSAGSVGANYIEANESMSKKDSKESRFWLFLTAPLKENQQEQEKEKLVQETTEIMKILGSILEKSK